jgi:hypothetical protein
MMARAYVIRNGVKTEVPLMKSSHKSKIQKFSAAFFKWVKSGFPKRTKDQIRECLSVCSACSFWNNKGNLGLGECTHPKCGCTRFKPQWATEDCPINKWPKLDKTEKVK